MKNRVTLKQVAQEAGVHLSTASLAMRSDPRLRPETRQRVQDIAKRMGYAPDAMMSALAAYRSSTRPTHCHGELAYLTDYPSNEKHPSMQAFQDFAQKRAADLGYTLVEFPVENRAITPRRLMGIWKQRSIRGILIGPWSESGTLTGFDWTDFVVVAYGHSTVIPGVNRSSSDQFENMLWHLNALRSCGYRRIGLHLHHMTNIRSGRKYLAAYLCDQYNHPQKTAPKILHEVAPTPSQLRQWIDSNRLDCVISHIEYLPVLRELGYRIPDELGFSLISKSSASSPSMPEVAGLDERADLLAASAIDFLVSLIHQDYRGLHQNPRNYSLLCDYHFGDTVRRPTTTTIKEF
ncbi:LacI family DNA-binding transcriptional regulator [Ruficoccus sp. ZRK36]|uniref:LacI family DNA-binding transcriptional regulator n=1 Tax=Ruficoccus sp. ZRK36 TaxID=2866311 RepID=UPI001C72DD20|nr:LacI family DNA-binding transcriptional regulator [Ruficoccus sp. ZRK36]QYY36700.1 LacI family DNA-binding transcriptional regulator [Ruficoccus sp. ZRK36]